MSLGIFDTNHFFRVDKSFVVQTADAGSGRTVPLNAQQQVQMRALILHVNLMYTFKPQGFKAEVHQHGLFQVTCISADACR